jgi:uncharacterized protein YndB with AHSA1/START domain
MPDILQDFPINASRSHVFQAISTSAGLDAWWTKRSTGNAVLGATYELWFGLQYDWQGVVTRCELDSEFELRMVRADADWNDTHVGFRLEERGEATWVAFHHMGWPISNEHFRISCHCWALYLRILRRHLEHGETVDYECRLSA